jgi:ABC-type proline/glycine betaine transport system permease subunit
MSTNNNKNVHLVIETGMALVIIGVGLNALVTWTLGSFDAASVLLALYVGFWAYVLGTMALIILSIWLVLMRKQPVPRSPVPAYPLVRPCIQ